jgi:DNA-binding Xre family transcriptional regulator
MIKLDVARLLQDKEISNPLHFLKKSGFNYHTAYRLLNSSVDSIPYKHLEKLCLLLNCTPNDLFAWTPSEEVKKPEQYHLYKLSGRKAKPSMLGIIKNLPEDKLNELHEFAMRLTKSENTKE